MQTTRVFDMTSTAWLNKPRYISSCGGTRSGKTFSILQLLFLVLCGEEKRGDKPTINSIVSESIPHLKRGAIRDFKTILQSEGIWNENKWNETDKFYKFDNGSIIEFFGADNSAKVFGAARDRLFINECQHISYESFRQLAVRTRKIIILDYNPTHSFWANEKVETRDNCIRIHSTYKDNGFLSPEQVAEIESNKNDENWWRVFGEGRIGTLEGVIYDFETIDEMPPADGKVECYGLDFGFTNDPTALLHILADTRRKEIFIDEVCYKTRMLNGDIAECFKKNGIPKKSVEIFADCAEPKSIEELAGHGYNVKPCYKGKDIQSQIGFVKGWKLYVTKSSVNTIKEMREYTWKKDKDENMLNVPNDKWDHAMDAMRYGIFTKLGNFKRPTTGGRPRAHTAW